MEEVPSQPTAQPSIEPQPAQPMQAAPQSATKTHAMRITLILCVLLVIAAVIYFFVLT